jgi:hypothetical protein
MQEIITLERNLGFVKIIGDNNPIHGNSLDALKALKTYGEDEFIDFLRNNHSFLKENEIKSMFLDDTVLEELIKEHSIQASLVAGNLLATIGFKFTAEFPKKFRVSYGYPLFIGENGAVITIEPKDKKIIVQYEDKKLVSISYSRNSDFRPEPFKQLACIGKIEPEQLNQYNKIIQNGDSSIIPISKFLESLIAPKLLEYFKKIIPNKNPIYGKQSGELNPDIIPEERDEYELYLELSKERDEKNFRTYQVNTNIKIMKKGTVAYVPFFTGQALGIVRH